MAGPTAQSTVEELGHALYRSERVRRDALGQTWPGVLNKGPSWYENG
jgi:hypothetical protein